MALMSGSQCATGVSTAPGSAIACPPVPWQSVPVLPPSSQARFSTRGMCRSRSRSVVYSATHQFFTHTYLQYISVRMHSFPEGHTVRSSLVRPSAYDNDSWQPSVTNRRNPAAPMPLSVSYCHDTLDSPPLAGESRRGTRKDALGAAMTMTSSRARCTTPPTASSTTARTSASSTAAQ